MQFETRLSKADADRIYDWKITREVALPPKEGEDDGEIQYVTKTVKPRFDATDYSQVLQLNVQFALACDVITAWLQPQWSKSMTQEQFSELLTPEFVAEYVDALGERVRSTMRGPNGPLMIQQCEQQQRLFLEAMGRSLDKSARMNSGSSTPESSDSGETPTT